MSDTYRDTFMALLKQGKTPLEALNEFDREKWDAAVSEEIMGGSLWQHPETFELVTQDGLPSLLQLSCRASRERMNAKDMEQALELWLAGWTSESVRPESDVFQWQWRAPAKRVGKLGRKYLSTNQAYNAMKRGMNGNHTSH